MTEHCCGASGFDPDQDECFACTDRGNKLKAFEQADREFQNRHVGPPTVINYDPTTKSATVAGYSDEVGIKHDAGKIRPELIPPVSTRQQGAVLGYGAVRYSADNWQKHDIDVGIKRHIGALLRHITSYQGGEALDPESGLHHLSHVLTNASFLVWAADRQSQRDTGVGLPERWNTLDEDIT